MHQKPIPDPFLLLVNISKQPLHARKNEIIWKVTKNPSQSQLYFFFQTQSHLMDNVIKNKRGLELVTSRSSGYETSSEKFLIIWPSLMMYIISCGFWVILKTASANSCKPLYDITYKLFYFHLSFCTWKLWRKKKLQKFEYLELEIEKSF